MNNIIAFMTSKKVKSKRKYMDPKDLINAQKDSNKLPLEQNPKVTTNTRPLKITRIINKDFIRKKLSFLSNKALVFVVMFGIVGSIALAFSQAASAPLTATITSPPNHSTLRGTVSINVTVSNVVSGINKVTLGWGFKTIAIIHPTNSSFSYSWDTAKTDNGYGQLYAIVIDGGGRTTTTPLSSHIIDNAIAPTLGGMSVALYGADGVGTNTKDDTAAFTSAMSAALASSVRYAQGPNSLPQAVVYVPAGTYRIFRLHFQDNIRLEVDAGAVLEQAGNVTLPVSQSGGPTLIYWDGPSAGSPLTNVSLVGVGTAFGGLKDQANPVTSGWNISHSFTFNLDPVQTGGNNYIAADLLAGVDGFLIQNVYTIQNAQLTKINSGTPPYPASDYAVFVYRPRNDTPIGGPYYDPHNGTMNNVYDINSPYGYGPTQITSGHNLTFSGIFSKGGTTLRLETDANLNKSFGGELRDVTAGNIVGLNCNRVVAFTPHAQNNYDIHVSNVISSNCHDGVRESWDGNVAPAKRGSFQNSTISTVNVNGGNTAQLPDPTNTFLWVTGLSDQAFSRDQQFSWSGPLWSVIYSKPGCSGNFQTKPPKDKINIGGSLELPHC